MTIRQTLLHVVTVLAVGACSAEPEPTPDTPTGVESVVAAVDRDDASDLEKDEGPGPGTFDFELGYEAREGRALFEHYCAICHGEQGRGDGFNAYNLDPRPRDLSESAFQELQSDEELSELIRSGGAAAGLSTAMPPWGRTINDRGVHYLVSYLRELRPEEDETGSSGN